MSSNIVLDNTLGLTGRVGAEATRPGPTLYTDLNSSQSSPLESVSGIDGGLQTPAARSPLLSGADGNDWQHPAARRMQSGLASSIFPSGRDQVHQDYLSTPHLSASPNSQSLTVTDQRLRSHGSPHPLVPSTPMTPENFTNVISPGSPHNFAQAQARNLSLGQWRNASTSQAIASRLPIGGRPSSSNVAGQRMVSPRAALPRIRQHHYPRRGAAKQDFAPQGQTQDESSGLKTTYPPHPSTSTPSANMEQESLEQKPGVSLQVNVPLRSIVTSMAASNSSSTRTQRDSSLVSSRTFGSETASFCPAVHSEAGHSSGPRSSSRHSESIFQSSTENGLDDDGTATWETEGEVQVASRVIAGTDDAARTTVVGVAPAVFFNHNSLELFHMAVTEDQQNDTHLDMPRPDSNLEPDTLLPPSPRDPPSIHSPPSHHTDIPESIKTVTFSEDVHGAKHPKHLPVEEVLGYGFPGTLWNVGENAPSDVQSPQVSLGPGASNKASSFKSAVSHISSRSRTSTLGSKVSKASRKSNQSTPSSRWTWLKRKPLPPLPTELQPTNASFRLPHLADRAGDSPLMLERGSCSHRSKVSLPQPGVPQGWSEDAPEKWYQNEDDASDSLQVTFTKPKFKMLAEDSLKVTKQKMSQQQEGRAVTSEYDSKDTNSLSGRQHQRRLLSLSQMLGRRKRFWVPLIGVVVIVIALSIALSVTLNNKHNVNGITGGCSYNMAGARCDLSK